MIMMKEKELDQAESVNHAVANSVHQLFQEVVRGEKGLKVALLDAVLVGMATAREIYAPELSKGMKP